MTHRPGPRAIPLTAAEIKRLINLVTRTWQTTRHYLAGPGGGAGIRPEPAGSTGDPACAGERPIHDQG